MTNISVSNLERVRLNPVAYAQLISTGDAFQKGGTHGMFAFWQDIAKQMHQEELTISESLKKLYAIYHRSFKDSPSNEKKQEGLYQALVQYEKAIRLAHFSFYEGRKRVKWPIIPDVQLTGLTPWVFKKGETFYSYFYAENSFYWQSDLKYPILQQYLADQVIGCELKLLHIGVYFLDTSSFESRNYTVKEVKDAIAETAGIFENVKSELSRKKFSSKK
jgi:hypothetical protein